MSLLAALVQLLGPAPAGETADFRLQPGDQIVAIGDSITQAGGYLRDVDAVLAKAYPDLKLPRIINVGISGQKAEDMVARFQKDVIDQKPQVVTISVGINDVWHRVGAPHDPAVLERYKSNVRKMVEMAQSAGATVILVAPTLIQEDPASEGNQRLKLYVAAEKEIAAERKCRFADLHQLFLDALAKKPADAGNKWLTSDGVHMNPRGDALMALGLLRAIGVPDSKFAAAPAKQ
jgi:lysophospholipase L1-like esterase